MSAVLNDERYAVFLELLPKYNYNVTKSAIEAGFSRNTANTQQKRIMKQALKYRLGKAGIEMKNKGQDLRIAPAQEIQRTMAEMVGFSQKELMDNLKELGTQDKDLSVRLRVIAPLAREYGVNLSPEEREGTMMPVLAITVRKNGPVEPQETQVKDVAQYTLSVIKDEEGGGVPPEDTE